MFLVKDTSESREARIQTILIEDPPLAALLSVIHFEWTVRRAIIALGASPNVEVRKRLERCHGDDKYKDLWRDEVFPKRHKRLTEVVTNWEGLRSSFRLRHKLVHGVQTCSEDHAAERALWAIAAAVEVRSFALNHGIDLDARLPVRRRSGKPISSMQPIDGKSVSV